MRMVVRSDYSSDRVGLLEVRADESGTTSWPIAYRADADLDVFRVSLDCTVVIPTIGRPSLERLLTVLDACDGTSPAAVIVVDDRADRTSPLCRPKTGLPVRVLSSSGGGP